MIIFKKFNNKTIDFINSSNDKILVELPNTKQLSTKKLSRIKKNCKFRIYGGISNIEIKSHYLERITYSLEEIKKIILKIENIEKIIDSNDAKDIYEYLRNNIEYDASEKNDKKIRSLCVLLTKRAVCSGYSLVLKELLDRAKIKSKYIKYKNHAWNLIKYNSEWIEVDLTWDACVYKHFKNSNFHYFGNNYKLFEEHFNYKSKKNIIANDILEKYDLSIKKYTRNDNSSFMLGLLPIGEKKKYYIYIDEDTKCLISTFQDFEILFSKETNKIIKNVINDFISKERVTKYLNNNISKLGNIIVKNNVFYMTKDKEKDDYILNVETNDIVYIETYEKKYYIDKNLRMEMVKC